MDKKNIKKSEPDMIMYLIIIAVLDIILFLYNKVIAIGFLVLLLVLIIYYVVSKIDRNKKWQSYIESLSLKMDKASSYAILNMPFPLAMINLEGNISWHNSSMAELFPDEKLLNENITNILSNFKLEDITEEREFISTKLGDKYYKIFHHMIEVPSQSKGVTDIIVMLYFIDDTDYNKIYKNYVDERPVVAIIEVDNYDDVVKSIKEDKKLLLSSEVDKRINLWASRMNAVIKKYENDKYLVLIERKFLDNLEQKKFMILDEVKELDFGNKNPLTISIGVGTVGSSLSKLEESAYSALELALSRGGDQAVVMVDGDFKFYGGKTKAVQKSSKVKARVIAHGLRPLIDESPNIFIMGHKNPDMDCIGSAIGMYRAVLNRGKKAYIVLEESNEAIKSVYELFKDDEVYRFVTHDFALSTADENDLVIIVDTHKPSITECEELIKKTDRVVVIDHHRVGKEQVENALIRYTEPYASSASELVTEILQYIGGNGSMEQKEAEALLAGISVDTKNFSFKTGVRTFEAASYLRRAGADTTNVKQLFQDDIETFVEKSNIVSTAQNFGDNIAIAICPDGISNPQLVAAQGADALLNIRGISASFVIGKQDEENSFISARSLGDINVQLILEKLGGGGHLEAAGAQLNKTVSETKEILKNTILEYKEEEEKK